MGALSYRMLECPDQLLVAQVDNKGLLSSGSLAGTSSLLVTSQETFGVNQTLVLAVKVSGLECCFLAFPVCLLRQRLTVFVVALKLGLSV